MQANTFPLIEMEGTPFEMGYQHGSQAKDMIAHGMEMAHKTIVEDPWELLPQLDTKMTFKAMVDMALQSLPYTEEHAPDMVEEMRGIAEGSGFTFEEIFFLNCECDIWITLFPMVGEAALAHNNCSTYAVGSAATEDGGTYVGWNADTIDWFATSSVILKGKPNDGLPFLCWNYSGVVGRPGVNPHLGLGANGIWPYNNTSGLPYPVVCRKILQQKSVADAIAVIRDTQLMCGVNYMLGDEEGNVAAVEGTSSNTSVIRGTDGKVVHTNHIVADEMVHEDALHSPELAGQELLQNSRSRHERLTELIVDAKAGSITLEDLKAAHADHANSPDSVCCHPGGGEGEALTLASMIAQPGRSKLLVTRGNPCENEFVEYTL